MVIREYQNSDSEKLFKLFCDTIYFINSKDYTKSSLRYGQKKIETFLSGKKSLSENYTLVAEEKNIIIGFGNINETGYLDMLYVHKDFQRKILPHKFAMSLKKFFLFQKSRSMPLITAKPFFEKKGI